jgi:hypothetical protein
LDTPQCPYLKFKIGYLGFSMAASTGTPHDMIGILEPIIHYHVLDKTCILVSILEYTLMQLIMGILGLIRGFTERKRKITLFFILTTWVLLCDGRCRDDAVDPFQSSVRHGNTVVGITRRGDGYGLLGLGGH